jgi:uncharacterized protein
MVKHTQLRAGVGALLLLLNGGALLAASDVPLVQAARRGDLASVRALLDDGADINAPYGDGTTALHWAAYRNDTGLTDLLVRRRALVNTANDNGATPLWVACSSDSTEVILRLLQAGANPNLALPSGETPLMTAARTGNIDAVRALLSHGANVNAAEARRSQTALMWAVSQRHADVVRVLAEAGANVHARSRVWRELVNVGGDGNVFLTTDVSDNPADVVEVEQGGSTPLLFAARVGDIPSAEVLLAAGANMNDKTPAGASALVVAAHSGQGAFAAFLLQKGADPHAADAGYTALHAAVLRNDLPLVKALLAGRADPNVTVIRPTYARRSSQDYGLTNPFVGATPFWIAAIFRQPETMRVLLAAGADPLRAVRKRTALFAAVWGFRGTGFRGRASEDAILETARVAVGVGIDVNAADAAGNTALHGAALSGFDSVVQFLADQGAGLSLKNRKNETPLALTEPLPLHVYQGGSGGHKSTGALLRALGARE